MQPAMLISLALTVVKVSTCSLSGPQALVGTVPSVKPSTTVFNALRLILLLVQLAKMDTMLTKTILAQSATLTAQHV